MNIAMLTNMQVGLALYKRTDTILLGHHLGTADTVNGKLHATAIGNTMRFNLDGYHGFVDVDIRGIAERAGRLIAELNEETRRRER